MGMRWREGSGAGIDTTVSPIILASQIINSALVGLPPLAHPVANGVGSRLGLSAVSTYTDDEFDDT